MIDPQTIQRIIDTADIVDVIGDFVSLKKRGANYMGLCPFHNEKTPSFSVSPSKGIFKCFGCGKGGNVVNFVMEYEHLSYPEALRYLAKKYNIEIEERELTEEELKEQKESESLYAVTEFARKFFSDSLYNNLEGISVGLTYFKERGFLQETLKAFDIGYCPGRSDEFSSAALKAGYKKEYLIKSGLSLESGSRLRDRFAGRVIFPIHGLSGRVTGFGGRVLKQTDKTAKYVNSPESPIYHKSRIVYGIYQARKAIMKEDRCYLVEGYTDVLSLHQNGIKNVVASSGTSLTENQIRLIKRFTKNITIIYDGDPAGVSASLRGIDMVLEEGMNVRVLLLPEGEDPDSFAKKHSASELKEYISGNEQDFIHFKTLLLSEEASHDPVKKAGMIRNIVSSVAVIPDSITRSVYVKECSNLLDVAEDTLYFEINKIRRKQADKKIRAYRRMEEETFPAAPKKAQPLKAEQLTAETFEKELLRLLLLYGSSQTIAVGKKPRIEYIPVADYIIRELHADHLEMGTPLHKVIYDEYTEMFKTEGKVDIRYFVNHTDPVVSTFVADLISSPYEISKIWSRHDNHPETEEMKIKMIVPKTILALKYKKVEEVLQQLSESLKKAQEDGNREEEEVLLKKIIQVSGLKREISRSIGARTIQPL
jgi:DNA primase